MSRAISRVGALALFAAGCVSTPGYRVTVEAKGLARIEPELVRKLEGLAKGSGFRAVSEGHEDKSPRRMASVYAKTLSQKKRDYIEIDIYRYEPEMRIAVHVECLLRGMEEPVKTEIDGLGDLFAEELVRAAGKDKVFVKREPAHIPFVF